MTGYAVQPAQLTVASEALRQQETRVSTADSLRYWAEGGYFGGEPLGSAVAELQQSCGDAMGTLLADLAGTSTALAATAAGYLANETTVAESAAAHRTTG